jgi:hypothetical protein
MANTVYYYYWSYAEVAKKLCSTSIVIAKETLLVERDKNLACCSPAFVLTRGL